MTVSRKVQIVALALGMSLAGTDLATAQVYVEQVPAGGGTATSAAPEYVKVGKGFVPYPTSGELSAPALAERTVSHVTQTGTKNDASVNVTGAGNVTLQMQTGDRNASAISIAGTGNTVGVTQTGNRNESNVSLGGPFATDGNTVQVQQFGNRNDSDVTVTGRNNAITNTQIGSGLTTEIKHIGNGQTISVQRIK
jgi:hypothetical protein